jgi:CRP/FNR family transcriptional regulator, anaerobic regulatory protein
MSTVHDLDPGKELRLVRGFAEVSPDAVAALAPLVVQRHVRPQEVAMRQGEVAPGLVILVRGAVKVVHSVEASEGEVTRVLDVHRASTLLPDPSALDGTPSDVSVVALRACQLFIVERRALSDAMAAHRTLERALLARFVRDSRAYVRRLDELASGSVEERVHRVLTSLASRHGTSLGQGKFIALPLRRKDLASMVNVTTGVVSRLLAKLEREGQVRSTRDGIWWRTAAKPAPVAEAVPLPEVRDRKT